jgi:hypothetical protein
MSDEQKARREIDGDRLDCSGSHENDFETAIRTNWHDECANQFLNKKDNRKAASLGRAPHAMLW